jgi:hypothetical protein
MTDDRGQSTEDRFRVSVFRFQGQHLQCLTPDTRHLKPIKGSLNLLKKKLKY